eukprot:2978034-Pleurochrysis_carterae.AAC.2
MAERRCGAVTDLDGGEKVRGFRTSAGAGTAECLPELDLPDCGFARDAWARDACAASIVTLRSCSRHGRSHVGHKWCYYLRRGRTNPYKRIPSFEVYGSSRDVEWAEAMQVTIM